MLEKQFLFLSPLVPLKMHQEFQLLGDGGFKSFVLLTRKEHVK
jgi:hypothetical protein